MSQWVAATRLEYNRLTPEAPFWPWVGFNPRPRPLSSHVHEGFEVGMVLAGREDHLLESTSLDGNSGGCWLCAPWEPHAWQTRAANTEVVVVMFLPEFLGDGVIGERPWQSLFDTPPEMRLIKPGAQERDPILALSRELRREILERPHGWDTAVRLGVLRFLLLVSRHWQSARYPFPMRGSHLRGSYLAKLKRIEPALRLLDGDPVRHVSLSEAAGACSLSRSRFAALFRQLTGLSFGEFCLQVKVMHSSQLLLDTSLPMDGVAEQSGFANASHLHRAFQRYHLCTPGEYRKQGRRGP